MGIRLSLSDVVMSLWITQGIQFATDGLVKLSGGIVKGRLLAAIFAVMIPVNSAFADDTCANPVGEIFSVQGQVLVNTLPASRNQHICPSAVISVGSRSRAGIRLFETDTVIRIDQNTVFEIKPSPDNETLLDLFKGIVHLFSREPESLRVETPYVNSAVEGTEFIVIAGPNKDEIIVIEGTVRAMGKNESEGILLSDGDRAIAGPSQTPTRRQTINPLNAVRWALHYPSIGVKETASKSTREARSLLIVGRSDDASNLLTGAIEKNAGDTVALALQTMILVAQNNIDEAYRLAQAAVAADPESSAAFTALSYVQQAQFEIQAALASAEKATTIDPDNAYAWARRAELELSIGDLDKALASAKSAVQVEPGLARTQAVLGFAHLVRTEIPEAISAFESAIDLDQGDPLPRLGLGLAKIRINKIAEGRSELEIAVSLDPNNSLFRSYLGKAYFEERRDLLDGKQYAIAKELDPNDPTPWFYDAMRKQTINRPIEALRDLQKSIQLNDRRAIYRSRLLLDSDLASRGASLARIYIDLGFEKRALNEAANSYALDPTSHSVHRFLSDTYAKLPGHNIARDSELLQSQLLQPINIVPVPARLGDDGALFLDNFGLGATGFNEFTHTFTSNDVQLVADATVGEHSTFSDNLILSGVYNNLSYSLAQFHLDTDGIRENNDRESDIYNFFLQYSPTPRQSFQFEGRKSELESGHLDIFFDFNSFFPQQREIFDTNSYRLGYRNSFTVDSTLLISYVSRELDNEIVDGTDFASALKADAEMLEVEILHRGNGVDVVSGVGYFTGDADESVMFSGFEPFSETSTEKHYNGYVYGTWHASSTLDLIAGVSYDDLDFILLDRNETNPKLGIVWKPGESTILRAAALSTVKRPVISSQTIEPTQVAGFNQFFDDINGSKIDQVGASIEHTLSSDLTIGGQAQRRELATPIFFASTGEIMDMDQSENIAVVYANKTIGDFWAASAEVLYEDRDFGSFDSEPSVEIQTIRVPFEIRYFKPNGFFSRVRATFLDQDAPIANEFGEFIAANDRFWTADIFAGYRLKKRRGTISFGVTNLFDKKFNFEDTDTREPRIQRERAAQVRVTLIL